MTLLDQGTQHNAALVEESSAAAEPESAGIATDAGCIRLSIGVMPLVAKSRRA
jgi:hypothetical protein